MQTMYLFNQGDKLYIIENIENLGIIVDKNTIKSLQGDNKIKDCIYPS